MEKYLFHCNNCNKDFDGVEQQLYHANCGSDDIVIKDCINAVNVNFKVSMMYTGKRELNDINNDISKVIADTLKEKYGRNSCKVEIKVSEKVVHIPF